MRKMKFLVPPLRGVAPGKRRGGVAGSRPAPVPYAPLTVVASSPAVAVLACGALNRMPGTFFCWMLCLCWLSVSGGVLTSDLRSHRASPSSDLVARETGFPDASQQKCRPAPVLGVYGVRTTVRVQRASTTLILELLFTLL